MCAKFLHCVFNPENSTKGRCKLFLIYIFGMHMCISMCKPLDRKNLKKYFLFPVLYN